MDKGAAGHRIAVLKRADDDAWLQAELADLNETIRSALTVEDGALTAELRLKAVKSDMDRLTAATADRIAARFGGVAKRKALAGVLGVKPEPHIEQVPGQRRMFDGVL